LYRTLVAKVSHYRLKTMQRDAELQGRDLRISRQLIFQMRDTVMQFMPLCRPEPFARTMAAVKEELVTGMPVIDLTMDDDSFDTNGGLTDQVRPFLAPTDSVFINEALA
jgi:hypothetical protein